MKDSYKILNISNFIKNYNTDYYCHIHKLKQLMLSKLSQWLPRENKYEANNIFWFKKINNKFKKINCFNYLVLVDKILFKNKNNMNVTNYDKKIFRKETSVLNICLENPNVYLCNNNKELIDFYKCGSKFIKNNMNHILFKNNDKNIQNTNNIYKNILSNAENLYKLNNINISKFNLVSFLKYNTHKKKYNKPFLDYHITVENYQELLNDMIHNIVNNDTYKLIEII